MSFQLFKHLYVLRHYYREQRISSALLQRHVRSFVLNVLASAVFIFLFEYLAKIFPYEIPFSPTKDELGLLISTVVLVCGILLGLYFTAASAVAGNLFMRATEDLQQLFLRERKGRQYIKTLVFTAVIGIFYLFLQAFDYSISPFGPVVIALLAAYSIVRFLSLGSRTFYFIHPVEAAATITSDASYAILNASSHDFGWNKPLLQNHCRRQAEGALATLRSLITFGIETVKLSEEQLVDIVGYIGGLFNDYLEKKKHIPSESYWYKSKTQFQNWILADSAALSVALNTGTSLAPQDVKDRTWFEEECIDIILILFNHFISKQQWESAHVCVEKLVSVTENLGKDFHEEIAELIIRKVETAVLSTISPNGDSHIITDIKTRQLALIDSFSRLGISVLIGFLGYLDKQTPEILVSEIKNIDWANKVSIYKASLPGALFSRLESTARAYKTEIDIEGHLVSPEWYFITITIQQYLFALKTYFNFLKSVNNDLFQKNIDQLLKINEFLLAAQLTDRWVEFANKLAGCGLLFQRFVHGCEQFRQAKDLPWIDIDFDAEQHAVELYNKDAVDKLIYLLPTLMRLKPGEQDLPDYFGQAYTFGVEACYQACLDNERDRFKKIFPSVFYGALSAYESTRKKVDGWTEQSKVIYHTEPLEDLLCLSGYAKLYAELYQVPDLWKVCEDIWNSYLGIPNAKDRITLIVAIANYRDNQSVLMPKAVLRTNWDTKFRGKLRELGLVRDLGGELFSDRESVPSHPSPLIRVVGIHGDKLGPNSRDVFFTTYLSHHPSAEGIDFPDKKDLQHRIDRETSRQQDHSEDHHVDSLIA